MGIFVRMQVFDIDNTSRDAAPLADLQSYDLDLDNLKPTFEINGEVWEAVGGIAYPTDGSVIYKAQARRPTR